MSHRTLTFIAAILLFGAAAGTAHAQVDSTASAQAPSKKVWTNEDLSSLPDQTAGSTSPQPASRTSSAGQKPASNKGRDAKWYHDQIARLQAQIPPIDAQIKELQDAIDGKPTGDGKRSTRPAGVKADDWSVERDNLEKKKDDILGRITALEDEARRNDIHMGEAP